MLIALNKPYGVLSQFTQEVAGQRTLGEFGLPADVYPVGRLDQDSEGLLLLTDEAALNQRLLDPRRGHPRTYWAQVEGVPAAEQLRRLRQGVPIRAAKGQAPRPTLPCRARLLGAEPPLWERDPPIRYRAAIPTAWLELELTEGRNRQVRRMTAAIGHPTLRLVRARIGALPLAELALAPGTWRELTASERQAVFAKAPERTGDS
jgi:23S rRNA pseudouridine2457 synthase